MQCWLVPMTFAALSLSSSSAGVHPTKRYSRSFFSITMMYKPPRTTAWAMMFLYASLDRYIPMKMLAMPRARAARPNVQWVRFQMRLKSDVLGGLIRMPAATCTHPRYTFDEKTTLSGVQCTEGRNMQFQTLNMIGTGHELTQLTTLWVQVLVSQCFVLLAAVVYGAVWCHMVQVHSHQQINNNAIWSASRHEG